MPDDTVDPNDIFESCYTDANGAIIEVGMYVALADMSVADDFVALGRGPIVGRVAELYIDEESGTPTVLIEDDVIYPCGEVIALKRGRYNEKPA